MAGALTASIAAIFSGSAVSTDPYFNLTTLLLSTTATNGQQNNTFLDSSTNNFTITRNPATGPNAPTQGTFSPFSQTGWGNYFDGAGDFINTPATGQFAPAGNFTIRFYFYLTSLAATNHLVGNYSAAATTDWLLEVTTGGVLQVFTNGSTLRLSQSGITANRWYYVTVTRTGTTITGQLDGTNFNTTATYTQSGTFGTATKSIYLGMRTGSTNPLTGYLSNVSLVDGSAIQTVPTAPLTDVTGTKLLTCQSNRFVDNSSSPNTLTIGGNTTVVPFSPFNPTSAWSASTVGGSAYYDGTGDSLTIPTAQAGLGFGTGDFSTEFWAYRTNANSFILIFQLNTFNNGLYIRTESTTYNDSFYFVNNSYNWDPATNFKPNSWTHICVTRQSGTLRFFANGKLIVNATNTSNMGAATADIGASGYAGYLSGVRVVKGSVPSEYQTSITTVGTQVFNPPTAPPTNVTNTQLLLNFTNSGIYDATAKNVLETVGNAQVSNTTSQWPSTSMSFNGTTDYLQVNTASDLYNLSSGNWTIEAWVYRTSTATNKSGIITYLDNQSVSLSGWAFDCGVTNAGQLGFYSYNSGSTTTTITSSAGAVPINIWTYVAATCVGTTITLYINGSSAGSGTRGTIGNNANCRLRIGSWNYPTAPRYWQGYIQDPRITKGVARIITTPTAAFPLQGGSGVAIPPPSVEYLVVAGGGGGASRYGGGGGGGGFKTATGLSVTSGSSITVTVGAGGAGVTDHTAVYYGTKGSNSVFSSVTSTGGGGGGGQTTFGGNTSASMNGGSGGGSSWGGIPSTGGTGTSGEGNNGGSAASASQFVSAGGGGAGAAGNAVTTAASAGGAGLSSSISGSSVTYAGGGGGGAFIGSGVGGAGGAGGSGGGGAGWGSSAGSAGTANTGGGGGGGNGGTGAGGAGNGGSGVVIIRYADSYTPASSTTGSPTVTVAGGYIIYRWTGNGSITF